jgi:hypothetical protein
MRDKSNEYRDLLDLYVRAVQAMAGKPVASEKAWVAEAEHLAAKLFFHLASLLYLRGGTRFERLGGIDGHFYDFASSAILARTAMETYLTFYFIFIAPTSDDERHFRFQVWRLGGLLDRQRFTPTSEEGRERLKQEALQIEHLRNQIQDNPAYAQLPAKRQEDARKGKWKFGNSWVDLAVVAGSSQRYFVSLYAYLSSYAHSGYLSALQIGQAQDEQVQYQLCEIYIGVGLTIMSHFLVGYSSFFSPVQELIAANPADAALLEKWHLIGSDMNKLYDDA